MNKLRRISVIFMSLLMLFAMTISVSAATKVQDGIEVTLNTNLQSYDKGEEIVTAITVKNTNSYAVTDVDISCVVPAGYALAKNVGVSTIPVLGANETKTLTVELEAVSGTATGDSSNMTLWGVLLVLALAGAVTLGIVYRKRWTRTLSLILCMAIVVSLLPANTMQISAATGSESAPYLVTVEAEKCWYDSSVYIEINEEYFSDSYTGSKVSLHEKHETAEKALENVSGDGALHHCANDKFGDLGIAVPSSLTLADKEPALTYTFTAPKAGTYYVWLRAWAAAGSGDSIFIAVDNETNYTKNELKDANGNRNYDSYAWYKVKTNALEAGEHTIKIYPRKQYLLLDKLLITDENLTSIDANAYVTSGENDNSEPTATPTPTVEPTATPTPTVEPTATPIPTAEPTATPFPEFEHNRIMVEAEDCIKNTDMYFVVDSESILTYSDYGYSLKQGTDYGEGFEYLTLEKMVEEASGNATVHSTGVGNKTNIADIPETPGLSYTFKAPEDGKYYVWVRVLPRNGNGNNIWFAMDDNGYIDSKTQSNYGTYSWFKMYGGTLTAGEHTINISARKQYIHIDKILIANADFTPTGGGEYVEPTPTPTPDPSTLPKFEHNRIVVEAEECTFERPYFVVNSENAGTYVGGDVVVANAGNNAALYCEKGANIVNQEDITKPTLTYDFNAPTEGKYYVWIRVLSMSASGDSIWVALDDGDYLKSNFTVDAENFCWQRISAAPLSEGIHTVKLVPRENNVYIDRLLITDRASLVPSGDGEYVEGAEEPQLYSQPIISPKTGTNTYEQHPRVWFTVDDIGTILENIEHEENSAALANHIKYRDADVDGKLVASSSYNYNDYYLAVAKSCAFEYAIKGKAANDDTYGKKAITIMENYLDTLVITSTDRYHQASEVVYAIGLVYDWCYDLLTDAQKDNFIEQGLYIQGAYTEIGWPCTKQSGWGGHGAEDQIIKNLLAFGIAVYDEKPYIYNTVVGRLQDDYLSQRRDLYYNAHKTLYGNAYGPYRFNADVSALFMLSKFYPEGSPNKNFWQNDEMHYVPYWYIYATKPDSFQLIDGDSQTYNIANPTLTGTKSPDYIYALLGSWYKDGYLKYMFLEEREDLTPSQYLEFLICNDPTVEPISKENLPYSKYFDYPSGQYIARTGWDMGKDSDDVVVSMSVNEVTITDHNHLDAGEFEIYYKGNLATDSGYYQAGSSDDNNSYFASDYWHNYYHQTIAHNCMLVLDPDEPVINFTHNSSPKDIANTGGQISVSKQSTVKYPETAENFKENENFNTCTVLGHEVDPYDEIKPDYTYLKGDLAGAYSEKVVNYERSFMFLNLRKTDEESDVPAVLIVFDHVVSSDASFKKTYLLHGINAPEISGTRTILKRTEKGYNGKLVNDTLLPKADNVTITQVGTDPTEYIVGNKTFNITGTSVGINEGGSIRTEISPIAASTEDYFLNVMQMSDADSTEEPLKATLIEAETHTGVVIADRAVLFGKTNERVANTVTFSFGEEESAELSASNESSKKGIFSWLSNLLIVANAGNLEGGAHKLSVFETVTIGGKKVKVEAVVTYNLPGDDAVEDDDTESEAMAPSDSSEATESTESSEGTESSESMEPTEPSTEPEEPSLYQITVADLKAGTWSYTSEDGSATGNVVVTEEGGVAVFEGPKGSYTLTYVNESTDRDIIQPIYEAEEMSVRVRFNTYYLFSEKEFIAENGEVMIPVDVIADALSVTLLWNETEKAATMSRYDRMVTITADEDTAVVNGEEKALTIKARMVEDTLYVPLTFIAEAFLARVEWVEYSKTAIVTDNVKPPVEGYIGVSYCWWDAGFIMGEDTDGYDTIDSNSATYWATGAAEPGVRFIAYDFGETKDVSVIEILWGNPHLRYFTFDVLVSEDGENWTVLDGYRQITSTLVDESAKDEYQTITLPEGTKARYIKLDCYGNTNVNPIKSTYANNIREIRFK